MELREFGFPSATGTGEISAVAALPEGKPKAVLAMHHGMAEHRERYLPFIRFLAENGIAAYMHDMAGHGKSVRSLEEGGWFGEKDGWKGLVEDFRTLIRTAAEENPGVPVFAFGHSMGSFICRAYCADCAGEKIAGAVFMGTGGPNPAAGAGKAMASLIGKVKGKKHRSGLLNKIAFGSYNERFEKRTEFDWLTRDPEIVDRYIADPYCGFLFTVQGMHDLIAVNAGVNADAWYSAVPAGLPILLVSGEEDPVGDYGKGVRTVAEKLKATGHTAVTLQLYPGCRHEVLNETNRQQVMEDVARWITDNA